MMEKILRNSPTISVVVVLAIQLTRVADFGTGIGAGWLAWVYAAFLAFSIYSLSYWVGRLHYEVTADPADKRRHSQQMRLAKTYERARFTSSLWLVLFIGIDGWLNLAETMAKLPADVLEWQRYGALVYGVFPTLAAFGLGSLQAMIDKIPAGPSKASFAGKLADRLLAMVGNDDKQGASLQGQVAPLAGKDDKPLLDDTSLLAYLAQHPQASDKQVASYFGKTRQAIQQRRKKLIERGAMAQQFAVHSDNAEVQS